MQFFDLASAAASCASAGAETAARAIREKRTFFIGFPCWLSYSNRTAHGPVSTNAIVGRPVDRILTGVIELTEESAMYFLGLGLILLFLKYMEIGPVAAWNWWVVLAPFGLAVAWWAYADWSGYTKKKEMEKMDKRKQDRIDKQRVALGMGPKKRN
ncbi:MAG: TIGR04438 family Trp-rich protein [Burkholderiaceae bacterium]|nr:TIGR04438 family Trp-rich protein [Burkholderiaceae bacterium]